MLLPTVNVFPQGVMLAFEWSTLLLYVGVGVAVYGLRLLKRYRDGKAS